MKKVIIGFIAFWLSFNLLYNHANAGEYEQAVIGHVITNSSEIDKNALLEAEIEKIGHQFALEMVTVMQQYLPAIIDGAMADLRLKLDSKYKCSLLEDTKIADKECQ
jgi:hypothetical protein